jgi:hypothetical protein
MPPWSSQVISGEVIADYSQIELHPGDGGHVFGMGDVGLANGEAGLYAVLITARQFGSLHVAVHVLDKEPAVDPSWDAAVEFSVHTGESPSVTGWAGAGSIAVPVPPAVDVRVRYVVTGAQIGWDQPAVQDGDVAPERHLVQVWPAAQQDPRVVVSTAPWSQYWTFGGQATALLAELADFPDPDRLAMVIDRALAAHPDVATRVREGDDRYHAGVVRYVQELFRITHSTGAYDGIRDDHERLGHLIEGQARRSGP